MQDFDDIQQPTDGGDTPGDAPDTTPQPLPDNLDVEELLAMGADTPATPVIDTAPPDGDDEDDDLDDDDEGEGENADGDADSAKEPPADVEQVVKDAALRIAQNPEDVTGILRSLPRSQRGGAVNEALRLAYTRGTHDMFVHQTAQSSQEQQLRDFYDERVSARSEDPEAFALWEDEQPEEAARFAQARAYFKAKADGKAAPLPGAPAPAAADGKPKLTEAQEQLNEVAQLEAPRLAKLPKDVQQALAAQDFPLTTAGIDAFRNAITAAEEAVRKGDAPAAAARRQEADRNRRATARVDVGQRGNAAPPKKNPIADIDDVDQLMEMAASSAASRR